MDNEKPIKKPIKKTTGRVVEVAFCFDKRDDEKGRLHPQRTLHSQVMVFT